jgi:multidrug resistance efflux pump
MAVIKREAPDQRRHIRSSTPIAAVIQNVPYTVKDWSFGGLCVEGYDDPAEAGEHLFIQLEVDYQGLDIAFTTEVTVIRHDAEQKTLAVRFTQLSPRHKELLQYTMLGTAKNGERASLIESLARIDIPVTPISPVPTPREAPAHSRLALFVKRAVYSLIYWTIGLALGAGIIVALYWYFCRLDLDYAVVSLPLHPIISQDVARCQEVFVQEGAGVVAGQPLLRVEDDVLSRDLEMSQLQYDSAKTDLKTAEGRVQKEQEKQNFYQKITTDKVVAADELVAALELQLRSAELDVRRARTLNARSAESDQHLEQATARHAQLKGELMQAKAERRIQENAKKAVDRGDFYDHFRLVGDLPQFLVNLQDARERLRLADGHLAQAKRRAERLTYVSPVSGKVVKILKPVASTINRGEALAIVEQAGEQPVIDAFVTQDDVNYLAIGSKASVWIPSLDRTYQAQVVKVDRTSGFLTEMQAHMKESQLRYNWRGQQDRSAYVQLAITDQTSVGERAELSGGMPATISVAKQPWLWTKARQLLPKRP